MCGKTNLRVICAREPSLAGPTAWSRDSQASTTQVSQPPDDHTEKNKRSLLLKTTDFLGNALFRRNSRLISFLPHRLPNLKIVSLLHRWPHCALHGPHLVPFLCYLRLFEIPCDSWHLRLHSFKLLLFSSPLYLTRCFFRECLFIKVDLIFAFFFCCSLIIPYFLSLVPFCARCCPVGLFFCFSCAL